MRKRADTTGRNYEPPQQRFCSNAAGGGSPEQRGNRPASLKGGVKRWLSETAGGLDLDNNCTHFHTVSPGRHFTLLFT